MRKRWLALLGVALVLLRPRGSRRARKGEGWQGTVSQKQG
jgi:hypothetical protein